MNSDANWPQAAQQMQETFTAGLQQMMGSFGGASGPAGFPNMDMSALGKNQPAIHFDPVRLQEIQQQYVADASAIWNQGVEAGAALPKEFPPLQTVASRRKPGTTTPSQNFQPPAIC